MILRPNGLDVDRYAQLQSVFENISLGLVIVDPETQHLYWNRAAQSMHGFTGSEDANHNLQEVSRIFELSTLDGTLVPPMDWPIHRLLRGELIGEVRLRVRRVQSDWMRVFHFTGARIQYANNKPLAFLTVNDVTEQRAAEEAKMRLAAIVNSSDDAVVGTNLDGRVSDWNHGAERLFGYSASEVLGRSLADIFAGDTLNADQDAPRPFGSALHREQFEALRTAKGGRRIEVSVTVSPIIDVAGETIGESRIARDITGRKRHERELQRLNRLYAALSQINQSIIRTPERVDLFQRICRALVEQGGFAMTWIGWHDPEIRRLLPEAAWGHGSGYALNVEIYTDERPEGRGPSGTAFRSNKQYICNDLMSDPGTLPWREEYRRHGFNASAAFPIRLNGEVRGVLTVYAREPDVFQDKEVSLLVEAAADISFALENAARDKERRQAQTAARREQVFSSTLIESMPGIFYFYDEQGRFLRWNQNLMTASGYSAGEIANMRPTEFIAAEHKSLTEERIREVFDKGESSLEAELRSKDGTTAPYYFTGKRIVVDGLVGLVGMGLDISARKSAEAEVHRLNAELEQRVIERTAQLNAANKELEAFSYSVSHDLRAPLRAVIGFAEIVLADFGAGLPDEGQRLLKRIRNRGLLMGQLIDDLLAFSRLGRQPLNRREVNMRALVEAALQDLAPQFDGRRIEFNLGELPPGYCDAVLLRQVWVNLLSNAIKYSRGRVPATVEVGSSTENGECVYYVRDNGAGFDMQFAHKLFNVFQRLHLADEFEGTGVGLAIVQRIVQRHGGRVWAEAEEQRGATFYFTLQSRGSST